MLYIKTKLKDGHVVRSGIREDNTFAVCGECGKEIPVHLGEVFSADSSDPLGADIVCPECTRKRFAKREPQLDDLVHLTTVLCRLGYGYHILHLYDDFGITAIQELKKRDYKAYADVLLSVVSKGGAV